jgi:tRNA wybutosine-synthesizing protein 4
MIYNRYEDKVSIARFGATLVRCANHLLLLGGITPDHITTEDEEVLSIDIAWDTSHAARIVTKRVIMNNLGPRPLLIGSSIYSIEENLIMMGGGAVCFSFGTFWNKGCFSLYLETNLGEDRGKRLCNNRNEVHPIIDLGHWVILQSIETMSRGALTTNLGCNKVIPNPKQVPKIASVPYTGLKSAADFSTIVTAAQPVILQELSIGNCTNMWTHDYLQDRIGSDRMVSTS